MGARMNGEIFNYSSDRATKARFAKLINPIWQRALIALTVLMVILGVAMVLVGMSLGWMIIGLAAAPAMLVEWRRGELEKLPIEEKSGGIDGLLATDILGLLPTNPTTLDLANAAGQVVSGQFMGARLGVGARFLQELAGTGIPIEDVWRQVRRLHTETGVERINGAVLAAAIIRSMPGHETLLAHLQLDDSDLVAGVRWFNTIQGLIDKQNSPRRTGGIARDWSFGYIPMLNRFGQNISEQISRGGHRAVQLVAHEKALSQLLETFGSGGRQNAVLVGETGVGKTTIVHSFAERLLDATASIPENLKFRQIFILDSSSLIAAAPGRGELENLVMHVLGEAYSAKNIIICLDNAQLFFEEGVGAVDLTNVLLPILEAGRLRIILTMDEQRYLKIGQRNPALINALNRISIPSTSESETIDIMQDSVISIEHQRKVTYMYQALKEAYRLSERYVHSLAMPGRALRLLESAAGFAENGLVTNKSVQKAIEETMDIKVGVASDESEREKLLNLEDLIHERMINQTRAVKVVSDALRRARAGVRSTSRPIGTFLFLGPTGVGKTELSKALADVYFGGEDRMIRLDLNEFVSSDDVSRLIADGADDPTSLTARVMKQPFSVVLLDEIEKAHPNVLTTLLQLLDEGILRDIKNREISFRDSIVIATSNAGAERIRELIERGYQLEQFEEHITSELISSGQFRPEFLNRFDEMVIFRPLTKPELVQVIDLMLAGVNKTLALQKVSVEVSNEAKLYLVDQGYDPRLGARPMRRVVQRTVENMVARQMLSGSVTPGSVITVSLADVQQILGSSAQAEQIIYDQNTLPPQ